MQKFNERVFLQDFSSEEYMAVRDTLDQIEKIVDNASHLPLTGKILIEDEELSHLVGELRRDLPQELERAEKILRDRDEIIKSAQEQADSIIKEAKLKAERLIDENDVVIKAREQARMVIAEAQRQESEILENTRQQARLLQEQADRYANQVFDQLIAHVDNTFQGVQAAEAGLQQAQQILKQSKFQMNKQSAQNAYANASSYGISQQQQNQYPPQANYDQNAYANQNAYPNQNYANQQYPNQNYDQNSYANKGYSQPPNPNQQMTPYDNNY